MNRPYRHVPVLTPAYRAVRRFVQCRLYAGDAVWCPVCERGFTRWLEGEDGACPCCRSKCRHRMLALYLAQWADGRTEPADRRPADARPADVLLFAPDDGTAGWLRRRPFIRLATTDLAAEGVDFHTDITDMRNIPDGRYDLVLCSHVLEHVPDDRRAMRELHRITRPGGLLLVQVPFNRGRERTDEDPSIDDPSERQRRFGQFDHIRLYGMDLPQRLRDAGFDVTEERWALSHPADAKRCGLWDDTIFVCRKPT